MSHAHHTDTGERSQTSGHAPPVPDDKVRGYYQVLGVALKELLLEKEFITPEELRRAIERQDDITPANGSTIVARAWTDDAYRSRLLDDPKSALAELGIELTDNLIVLENTESIHNVIVCTLCSCYPRGILGLPPAWYKSRAYRARVVRDPRSVLAEFGTELAQDVEIRVHDSSADLRYLVLPMRPSGAENMTEDQLRQIVTRDCLIGVALPTSTPR
jgi:nitrile hydratase